VMEVRDHTDEFDTGFTHLSAFDPDFEVICWRMRLRLSGPWILGMLKISKVYDWLLTKMQCWRSGSIKRIERCGGGRLLLAGDYQVFNFVCISLRCR